MSNKTQDYIVLNRMFVGDYCQENIGHEIINIFQTDDCRFFVYLNATGDFAADKAGRVRYVLLTRNCSESNTVQVIAKAKVKEDIYKPTGQNNQKKDKKIAAINYGGVSVVDLFQANTRDQNIYVTYQVEDIVEAKDALFISFENPVPRGLANKLYVNANISDKEEVVQMARASLKQYVGSEDAPMAYKTLLEAIQNDKLWKDTPVEKVHKDDNVAASMENFFKICKIQNDELVYSNAFAHLAVRYRKVFCQFAKEILDVCLSEDFEIHREKWNIDILIADRKNVIVIENKVMSHINGLWFDRKADEEYSQLKKYYNIVTGKEDKYNRAKEYVNLCHHFYILIPDHNNIDVSQYDKGDKYKIIPYSVVRDFIKKHHQKDAFVEQLLLAMEPHCEKSYDYYSEMRNAFLEQCQKKR